MRRLFLLGLIIGCKSPAVEEVAAYGYPNIDDDDLDGRRDWGAARADDDDRTPLVLASHNKSTKRLSISISDANKIRIWKDGAVLLDNDRPSAEVDTDGSVTLEVEFGEFQIDQVLTVVEQKKSGAEAGTPWTVPLRSSPLLMNHHLQPAIEVQSVNITSYTDPMVQTYRHLLGDRYRSASGVDYGFDVWLQDEIEYVTLYGTDGASGAVIDSVRDRGLDNFAEDVLVGPGMGKIVKGNPDNVTSQDSFGNLEATPPIEGYPFGRIYYGQLAGRGIDPALVDYFENKSPQKAFTLDISWLCVGHVDEFVAFVPDATAPKGFKVAIADTERAWELLEALDPSTPLPQYIEDFGRRTVADLLDDAELRALNAEDQALYLDTTKAKLMQELGLVESDFIYVPDLFEITPQCFGTQAALIPGMVNLVVDNPTGGPSRLFLADPFVRDPSASQDTDPFIQEMRNILPAEHELVFVDNWEAYHTALGEVHCGTNVIREPHLTPWWPTQEAK